MKNLALSLIVALSAVTSFADEAKIQACKMSLLYANTEAAQVQLTKLATAPGQPSTAAQIEAAEDYLEIANIAAAIYCRKINP